MCLCISCIPLSLVSSPSKETLLARRLALRTPGEFVVSLGLVKKKKKVSNYCWKTPSRPSSLQLQKAASEVPKWLELFWMSLSRIWKWEEQQGPLRPPSPPPRPEVSGHRGWLPPGPTPTLTARLCSTCGEMRHMSVILSPWTARRNSNGSRRAQTAGDRWCGGCGSFRGN